MADTREKLIELLKLSDACLCNLCGEEGALDVVAGVIADNLIANGVRLEEKQATSDESKQSVAYNSTSTEPLTNRQQWIPVTERLPEEHDSTFAKFYGTEKWVPGMFRTTSNDVNACVEYEDGTRIVKTLRTLDGKWNLKGTGGKKVTHWMPLPELPKD